MTKIVHTRYSTIKKKKYILPTNNSLNSINRNNKKVSNLVNGTDSIKRVPETQTQVDVSTQGPKVSFRAPKTPIKGVTGLGVKTAAD